MNKSKELREALDHLTDLTLYKIRTNNYKMIDSCTLMNIDQDGIKIERAIEKIKNEINDREDLKKELYDARDYLDLCKTMNVMLQNKLFHYERMLQNNEQFIKCYYCQIYYLKNDVYYYPNDFFHCYCPTCKLLYGC